MPVRIAQARARQSAANAKAKERVAELQFIAEQLRQQVNYGDGVLHYRSLASRTLGPDEIAELMRAAWTSRPDLWQTWSGLVRQALDLFKLPAERLDVLATEQAKAAEPAFRQAAERLSVRLVGCALNDLDRVSSQVLTPSTRVLEAKGVPSIAEASALVAAGRNACLLGARVATDVATCAIAVGDGP